MMSDEAQDRMAGLLRNLEKDRERAAARVRETARFARDLGMHPDAIGAALGMSRATVYRKLLTPEEGTR